MGGGCGSGEVDWLGKFGGSHRGWWMQAESPLASLQGAGSG